MQIAGGEVQITNPDKVFFPAAGHTKGDLIAYYLAVAEGAVRAVANRPMALKRYVGVSPVFEGLTCSSAEWRGVPHTALRTPSNKL